MMTKFFVFFYENPIPVIVVAIVLLVLLSAHQFIQIIKDARTYIEEEKDEIQ